jgi:hypothetical protein
LLRVCFRNCLLLWWVAGDHFAGLMLQRWIASVVSDALCVPSTDVEVLLRDADAASVMGAFCRGSVQAMAFLYQPREVTSPRCGSWPILSAS